MAWYLSEVVTDLSPMQEILALYDQTGSFSRETYFDEYQSRLTQLLRQSSFNTDHIDSIPAAYENDEYKWLASDFTELIERIGLTYEYCDELNNLWSFELTEKGTQVANRETSLPDLMQHTLTEWRNDRGLRPYQEILKAASDIKQRNLYPCGGLLLLEVLIILVKLNKPHGYIPAPSEVIQSKRREYYAYMSGDIRFDLIEYSGFLWEQLSQDLSNFHAANYPARATLQLMMYGGDLIYGPVPDEIFGLVQYVTVA